MAKIKFNIPGAIQTKIIVYDILGREAAILINEMLKPGEYVIDLDPVNLPAGKYLYKVIAQGFSETKKMILIK